MCATDGGELCSLLALGVTPVGFGQRNDPLRPWVRELAEGIDSYDLSGGETSFERLAAWAPDLVLAQAGFATDETLPRFTEIAPTVATSFIDWRDNLRQVATAVGRTDRADELEAQAGAAVADAAAALPEDAKQLRVRAITAFSDGSVYLLNDASPLGKVAAAMGLPALPARPPAGRSTSCRSSSSARSTATCSCCSTSAGTATAAPPCGSARSSRPSTSCAPAGSSRWPRTTPTPCTSTPC